MIHTSRPDTDTPTRRRTAILAILILSTAIVCGLVAIRTLQAQKSTTATTLSGTQTAYLAGGCFWGMEQLLREVDGVVDTEVGYLDAAAGGPGVAETVRVRFDPSVVTYEALLRFYFRIHDPTTRNRQGNDIGVGYRSAIFVVDDAQRRTAERVRAEVDASGFWKRPLVTEISDAGEFEVAEEGHQDYLVKNPGGYTCHFIRE